MQETGSPWNSLFFQENFQKSERPVIKQADSVLKRCSENSGGTSKLTMPFMFLSGFLPATFVTGGIPHDRLLRSSPPAVTSPEVEWKPLKLSA